MESENTTRILRAPNRLSLCSGKSVSAVTGAPGQADLAGVGIAVGWRARGRARMAPVSVQSAGGRVDGAVWVVLGRFWGIFKSSRVSISYFQKSEKMQANTS